MKTFASMAALALGLFAAGPSHGAFGLQTATDSYTVDTGAGLVFKVRRTDNGSSTQSAGDLMSLVYQGVEYQNTSKGSHLNSGFDFLYPGISAVDVSAETVGTDFIKITILAGDLTHYYLAKNGEPHIYMATHFTSQPDAAGGLCRFIVRIPSAKLPDGPVPSDIRGNTGAIESGDIFGMADGTTRSKHYSNMRLKDWSYIGATGPGVGMWMVRSNHEGDSGGPFYRSLLMQTGTDQEITYILNYGQVQTEPFRSDILNGPYVLVFTDGSPPPAPDTSWVAGMGLTGFVGPPDRGAVAADGITGRDAAHAYTIGFANPAAQYWTDAAAENGAFTCSGMLPGTYTMKVYKNELAVHTAEVSVSAGATTGLGTLAITADPSATVPLWRIGNWDGSPAEFLNGDKVTTMHPSDVRMAPWNPGTYVIGSSTPAADMPAYQWKDINGSRAIQFELSPQQVVASTIRVGITVAYSGARPNVSVNSWTSAFQGPSSQPNSRSLTTGSYRGNNTTYTFNVPASALVTGTNTLWISAISGSGGTGFLSPGYSLDAIDFLQGSPQTLPLPGAPGGLTATGANGSVDLAWTAADGAAGYNVLRATAAGGPFTTVATGVAGLAYSDDTVVNGTTYRYLVRGGNSSGAGPASAEATATAGGLVGWYALDGNALDASGEENHGTATAVTYPAEGGGLVAGSFNGSSSQVTIPRSIGDDFTVALWVKTTGTGGTGNQWWQGDGLVDGEVTGSLADWGLALLEGKVAFGIGAPDTTFFSTGSVNDGQWHHVAATRKNTSGAIEIYLDGVLQTTGTGPAGPRVAPPALRIGSIQTGSAGGFFQGGLSGVRLYNKVLPDGEIAALSAAGLQVPAAPADLVATAAGDGQIDLAWSAVPNAAGYTVKRATVSGGPYQVIAEGLTATAFSDTGLTPGTTYYYVLSASNANGEGPGSAPASATPFVPPPVAHLRFDDNAGAVASDATGNGWNGTLANGTQWTAGRIDGAAALDGVDDHVVLPAGVAAGLDDFTISVWVKWNGGNDWQRAFDFGTGTANYLFFTPRSFFGTARFAIRTPATPEQIIEGPPLATGVWTHVAVTLSGSTGTLYLNGTPAGSNDAMTLRPSDLGSTTQNYLGKSQFAADAHLGGSLDDFQIHSRALAPAEIGALAAPPSAPSGLAAEAGNATVALAWNPVAGATGYRVQRAASGGPFATVSTGLAGPVFTDSTVTNGTTYRYVVTALATVAESARSAEVDATPLSAIQAWRLDNFGSIENSGEAADGEDPDGDGTINEIEFRLGLDPNDGSSSFKAAGHRTPAGFELTWPSAAGVTFEIRRSTTLDGDWQLVGTVNTGTFTDTDPPTGAAFYRIALLP